MVWLAIPLAITVCAGHAVWMQASKSMTVSELKNKLLEVVRRVERGEVFEIIKGGRPVAILGPRDLRTRKPTGFARVEVRGSLDLPAQDWSYDLDNLVPRKPRRK